MKVRTPLDRFDLDIKKKDLVLEVGSGDNPNYRANVLVEKYVDDNFHRGGEVRIYPHQKFVNVDGQNMPFKNKEFDYVICNQVLEHVDDPIGFVNELKRVAKRGYIETPSLIGESLFPKKSHKWLCLEIDKKIVLYDKMKVPLFYPDFGTTFLNYLPYNCISLRIFYMLNHQVNTMRYEWENGIDIIVNPEDEYLKRFFTDPWTDEMRNKIFPKKSKAKDIYLTHKLFIRIIIQSVRKKVLRRRSIKIGEYLNQTH